MPELRKDPVVGRWIILSEDRAKRPHDFPTGKDQGGAGLNCPFCAGNEGMTPPEISRVTGDGRPSTKEWKVRVVPNKFPALSSEGSLDKHGMGMYDMMNGIGAHEVIIENPDHSKRLHMLSLDHVASILTVYQNRIRALSADSRYKYILVFKNEGKDAGASLEHSHSQIIATPVTPKRVKEELNGARDYYAYKDRCVFCDMMWYESQEKTRVVEENEGFIGFCPFASRFPFEMCIMPKEHSPDFTDIPAHKMGLLASVLKNCLGRLSAALDMPQYNFVLHIGPVRHPREGYWTTIGLDYHWHIEIMPHLTKVAGFEWGTGFYINPTPPELAAGYLRDVRVGA